MVRSSGAGLPSAVPATTALISLGKVMAASCGKAKTAFQLSSRRHARRERESVMAFDDFDPKPKKPAPPDLSLMSVEELTNRIAELEAEIARMKQAIKEKQSQRSSAEAFFKKN
jgi:uncharacterized small protein (DUF1192 family)